MVELHFNYDILWEKALFLLFVRRVDYESDCRQCFFFFNLIIFLESIGFFSLHLVVLCPKLTIEKNTVKQAMTTHLSGYKGFKWFEQMTQRHKIFYWLQHFFLDSL